MRVRDVGPGSARRGGGGGEELVVPEVELRSYYGRPILKRPVWTWDIAAYLFTGGLAAGASLLAAGADLAGFAGQRRAGRATSALALAASAFFLIRDLGRPGRFLAMLRVAKPTSPMSVGTWILTAFGVPAGIAAVAEAASRPWSQRGAPRFGPALVAAGRPAGLAAAATAPALATYTAVLLSDTAVPSWHGAHRHLPFAFAGSAMASGSAVGLLVAPDHEAGPARRLAVVGAPLELAGTAALRHRLGLVGEPYQHGRPGRLLRCAEVLTGIGVAAAVAGRSSRPRRAVAGGCLLAGSCLTRFGVFEAGVASTEDPRFVVLPQRRRLEAAAATPEGGATPEG